MGLEFLKAIEDALAGGEGLEEVFARFRSESDFETFLEAARQAGLRVELRKADGANQERVLSSEGAFFDNLLPGEYQLVLSTGWLLWEGRLSEAQLLLESGGALPLAADTGETGSALPLCELLPGELSLETVPGLESGHLRLRRED